MIVSRRRVKELENCIIAQFIVCLILFRAGSSEKVQQHKSAETASTATTFYDVKEVGKCPMEVC